MYRSYRNIGFGFGLDLFCISTPPLYFKNPPLYSNRLFGQTLLRPKGQSTRLEVKKFLTAY